jgi:hypothetical protein
MGNTRMFNGSTFSFGGTPVGKLIGISYKHGGAWVDVSEPEDLNKLYELGQSDLEVQLKFKGGAAGGLVPKTKGSATITWKDGTTSPCPGTWMVGPISVSGDHDNPISSTAELRPTVPDAGS